jgi:MFS transporter, YNFM family, putative membrane transport protein
VGEKIRPTAVTSRHRTAAVVLAGYCSFLQLYATQPLLPLLKRLFHSSELAVSLTVTVPSLGVALGAPFAGMLADRIGRRPVIVWSAFLLALTAFATSTATSLPQLIFWRFWQGVFTPGVFSVTVAYIHDEWRDGGAGRTVASYISGTVAGGFSCRMLSGLVAAHGPWQRSFVVLGSLNLVLAAAIWMWLPPETKPQERGPVVRLWKAVLAHLRNRQLLAAYLVGFCVLFSLVAAFTYITFHLAEAPYLLQPAALGSIFFVYLVGVVITPMAGRAIDHYGHRAALAVAIIVATGGIALTLSRPLWMIVAGLAVCSSGVFIAQASASAFVGTAAKDNRALAIGLYSTFYYVGGSIGAAAPSQFYAWGGWPACAAFIATVQVVTVLIALLFWKPEGDLWTS